MMSIIAILLIMFLIIISQQIFKKNKEGYLSPKRYISIDDNDLLLKDFYKIHDNPGLSNNNSLNALSLYPKSDMSSFEQKTNNKRHWFTPCNGSSIRSDICGALYKGKALKKNKMIIPTMSSMRVNMFDSLEF